MHIHRPISYAGEQVIKEAQQRKGNLAPGPVEASQTLPTPVSEMDEELRLATEAQHALADVVAELESRLGPLLRDTLEPKGEEALMGVSSAPLLRELRSLTIQSCEARKRLQRLLLQLVL